MRVYQKIWRDWKNASRQEKIIKVLEAMASFGGGLSAALIVYLIKKYFIGV
jgi:hypothetical protein